MKKIEVLTDENGNTFALDDLNAGEIKILKEIWDAKDQYECIDFSKLPLLCEYAKIFCIMQETSDAMKTPIKLDDPKLEVEFMENTVSKYAKLQKIVLDYRKILKLDTMKSKSTNRWAEILLKRG